MIAGGATKPTRRALRQFASSVAVLTYRDEVAAHGTTVSAVTTISHEPLLIGVSLRAGSAFARLVTTEGQYFSVNVLDARQGMVATWFADRGRPPGLAQFECVDWQPDEHSGAPLIAGSLAWISCRLVRRVPAGDHLILLAEAVNGSVGEGAPLLSFAGQLHDPILRALPGRQGHPAAGALGPPRDLVVPTVTRSDEPAPSPQVVVAAELVGTREG